MIVECLMCGQVARVVNTIRGTIKKENTVRRRRECSSCGYVFSTLEAPANMDISGASASEIECLRNRGGGPWFQSYAEGDV